jgi:hypothetical protein
VFFIHVLAHSFLHVVVFSLVSTSFTLLGHD